ncbi:M28 family peptidase [bacterium]|nr:M28 family peptidase [bacterium]
MKHWDRRSVPAHQQPRVADSSQNPQASRQGASARSLALAMVLIGISWLCWGATSSSMVAATGATDGEPSTSAAAPVHRKERSTERTAPFSRLFALLNGSEEKPGPGRSAGASGNEADSTPTIQRRTGPASPGRPISSRHLQKTIVGESAAEGNTSQVRSNRLNLSDQAIEERLRRDAAYLASDELEGRGVRTHGLDLAAEYLAEQFASAGLNTNHYSGTPFQEFELLSVGGESPVQQIEFRGVENATKRLIPDRDFSSLVLSRNAKLDVPVVFAGFGISAPEVGYDDYLGLDVAGKAVVVLRHAPRVFASAADDLAKHSYVRTKIAAASSRGAAAVVFCSDVTSLDNANSATKSDELLRVELTLDDGVRPVPVIHCRRDVLASVLDEFCGFDLNVTEREIDRSSQPASRLLDGLTLSGHVSQMRRGRSLKNVAATLDPAAPVCDETIILGAHYDHLGRGGWGSLTLGANHEVHNGADDNASGTAVMLEVARQLAAAETPLGRRVLFIGFSAEELGLIGSRKYVRDPLIPIDQSIAMLNLDMVGRLRNDRLTVYGTGSSKHWPPLLESLAPRQHLTIISKPSGYGPSDHASFYEAGVPVLHFFTGFHPQYHRPEDDVDLLNIEGMRRIASLIVDLVRELAQAEQRPPRSLAGDNSGQSILPLEIDGLVSVPTTAEPARPQLGVVPANRISGSDGILVGRTVAQSIADQHGIRTGDVIVRVGNDRVSSVEELVSHVRSQTRGSRVPIELVRNGIRLEVRVQF